ncbi:MAG TPA: cytochrome P450 [Zeimonas sp.]
MASLSLPLPGATRSVSQLPAPKGLPWIGNSLQIRPLRFHLQLERWAMEIGTPYRLQLGRELLVVWSDPDQVLPAMRERPHAFSRGPKLARVFAEIGPLGLFAVEGADWAPQRRMVMQALNATHFRAFFPALQSITERLYRRCARAADRGETLEMTQELMRYTVDVTSTLAFGEDPNTLEQEGDRIQRQLGVVFPMLMKRLVAPVPYWRWFRLPQDRRLDRALVVVHDYVREVIDRARRRMQAAPGASPKNLLEAMLAERDRPGSGVTDDTVAANVLTLLLAGEDTTANSLAWAMPFLAGDEALQQRLHAAALAVLGERNVCATHDDVRALELFEAVVNEAQRMHPVVALIGFAPLHDCEVGGVALPARLPNYFIHRPAMHDPRNFGDPERFDPDRWLHRPDDARAHESRAFLQFGTGPRVCPGRHLAGVEMRLVLSMLMRNFRLELACDPATIEEVTAFTVTPSRMPVRLHRRAPGG